MMLPQDCEVPEELISTHCVEYVKKITKLKIHQEMRNANTKNGSKGIKKTL